MNDKQNSNLNMFQTVSNMLEVNIGKFESSSDTGNADILKV